MGWGEKNEAFVRVVQRWLRDKGYDVDVDGKAGPVTEKAWRAEVGGGAPTEPSLPRGSWPPPDQPSLLAYYGVPGKNLVQIDLPYPMRLAWDLTTTVNRITCHERVAGSLRRILARIGELYGNDLGLIREARMDRFGGCYNLRKMRDRDLWSVHAWGAAIDLDPEGNGLQEPWPLRARMPREVIDQFELEGWTSLARAIGRDAMHFQATSWPK